MSHSVEMAGGSDPGGGRRGALARGASLAAGEVVADQSDPRGFVEPAVASGGDEPGTDLATSALWLGHSSPAVTHQYLEADLAAKEAVLQHLDDPSPTPTRFKPDDRLLASKICDCAQRPRAGEPTEPRARRPLKGLTRRELWFPPNRGGLPYAASRSRAAVFS